MDVIKISHINSITTAERAFHRLVDIVYVEEIGDDYFIAFTDNPDLSDPAELAWIIAIIQQVMHDVGETQVVIEKLTQQ